MRSQVQSNNAHILCTVFARFPVLTDLVVHGIAFLYDVAPNRGYVHENVGTACLRRYETEAFVVIKKFDSSFGHTLSFRVSLVSERPYSCTNPLAMALLLEA